MRYYIVCILLFFCIIPSYSCPAYPDIVEIEQDGDIYVLRLCGDENLKYAMDEEGYTVMATSDGWYYAKQTEGGGVECSTFKMAHQKTSALAHFLLSQPHGLIPTVSSVMVKSNHRFAVEEHERIHAPAIGNRKALIILMQFRNKSLTKSASEFWNLFNQENYSDDGAIGSVRDYYDWASYGQLNLQSDVLGPYTSRYDMSYYGGNSAVGGNDRAPYDLFFEAINEAVKTVSLSDYDADGDGYVDNVHIIYAGYGEEAGASADAIWAHEMTFPTIMLQGMKIDRYSCAPELRGNRGTGISRIGPHCHEIGHALGAMDYYDTDYQTGGNYLGTGNWDVMASGSWNNDGIQPADFNPYVKTHDYGWTEAKALNRDSLNVVHTLTQKGNIYQIDTGVSGDYFLLENRDGTDFHAAEPGRGLLIFHVGPQLEARARSNTINSTFPQQCYVVCASSTSRKPSSAASSYGSINSAGCPYPGSSGKREFSDTSTPAAFTVNGQTTGICMKDIQLLDNGDVQFFFKLDAENTPDDEPGGNLNTFWSEDFEQYRMPSSWQYVDIMGIGEMSVQTKLTDNDSPSSPRAASGRGYAKFVSASRFAMGRYRTVGRIITSQIQLDDSKHYILKFYARRFAQQTDANDSLRVSLIKANGELYSVLINSSVEDQSDWIVYSAELPQSIKAFALSFECNIDFKSVMFIDDMTIEELPIEQRIEHKAGETSGITVRRGCLLVNVERDRMLEVFRLDGICQHRTTIKAGEHKSLSLDSGAYIVHLGGKSIRIMVR